MGLSPRYILYFLSLSLPSSCSLILEKTWDASCR